jgi:Zn-dependent M28 family amino/carboxypeptidase
MARHQGTSATCFNKRSVTIAGDDMRARLLLLVLAAAASTAAQEQAPQADSIQLAELKADLYFLASDAMRGRLTDTPENTLAAEWIKARFERLGLKPAGDNGSYYHSYNLMTATLGSPNRLEVATGDAAALQLASGQDFYPQRFSASGRAKGALVFAGYGIHAPAQGHDDYRAGGLEGRVLLVFDHEPRERDPASPLDGVVTAEAASALRKTLAAQARGAAAVLFVSDAHNHPGPANFEAAAEAFWPPAPPRIERYALASLMEQVRIPALQISPALAATLVARSGRSPGDLAALAETAGGAAPLPLDVVVDVTTAVNRHVVPDRNVLAAIEGSDPKLREEWVVVCAHFDHNGADGDAVFNGADDDGSGTVALLEIAEAYALAAREGRRPKRSVLFAAWNSEERGLLGAWAYADAPLVPRDRIAAVLNMDMIGRNEEVPEGGGGRFRGLDLQTAESNRSAINIIGTARSADLKGAVQKANAGIGLELKFRYDNNASNLMRRSDHWPFIQHGVPALWFHTGLHPDYHTVYDRPEKINYEKMTRVARLVHRMSWDLAQQPSRPRLGGAVPTPTQP